MELEFVQFSGSMYKIVIIINKYCLLVILKKYADYRIALKILNGKTVNLNLNTTNSFYVFYHFFRNKHCLAYLPILKKY